MGKYIWSLIATVFTARCYASAVLAMALCLPVCLSVQMHVGWIKIGDFRQITGYISKTVQDRRMVSIKVE